MKPWLRRGRAAAIALLLAGVPACVAGYVREHTYPPSFNYIPKDRLQSTMWMLGARMTELDRLMHQADGAPPPQEEVVRLIADMERATLALGPGGWPSNHPRVSHNVEIFRRELAAAHRAAAQTPPNYFLAGSVSGGCLHCHDQGR